MLLFQSCSDPLRVRREHAVQTPRGRHLPTESKGKAFYIE